MGGGEELMVKMELAALQLETAALLKKAALLEAAAKAKESEQKGNSIGGTQTKGDKPHLKKTVSFDACAMIFPELRLLRAELSAKRDHLDELLTREKTGRLDKENIATMKEIGRENKELGKELDALADVAGVKFTEDSRSSSSSATTTTTTTSATTTVRRKTSASSSSSEEVTITKRVKLPTKQKREIKTTTTTTTTSTGEEGGGGGGPVVVSAKSGAEEEDQLGRNVTVTKETIKLQVPTKIETRMTTTTSTTTTSAKSGSEVTNPNEAVQMLQPQQQETRQKFKKQQLREMREQRKEVAKPTSEGIQMQPEQQEKTFQKSKQQLRETREQWKEVAKSNETVQVQPQQGDKSFQKSKQQLRETREQWKEVLLGPEEERKRRKKAVPEFETTGEAVAEKQKFWTEVAKEEDKVEREEGVKRSKADAIRSQRNFWENVGDLKRERNGEEDVGQDHVSSKQDFWESVTDGKLEQEGSRGDDEQAGRVSKERADMKERFWAKVAKEEEEKRKALKAAQTEEEEEAEAGAVEEKKQFWSQVVDEVKDRIAGRRGREQVRPNPEGLREEKKFWENVKDTTAQKRKEEKEVQDSSQNYVSDKQKFWSKATAATEDGQDDKKKEKTIRPKVKKGAMKAEKEFWENVTDVERKEEGEDDYEVSQDYVSRKQEFWSKTSEEEEGKEGRKMEAPGVLKAEKEFWENVKEDEASKISKKKSLVEKEVGVDYVGSRQEFWSGVNDEERRKAAAVPPDQNKTSKRDSWQTPNEREETRKLEVATTGDTVNAKREFWTEVSAREDASKDAAPNGGVARIGGGDVEAKQKFWASKAKEEEGQVRTSSQQQMQRSDVAERLERYRGSCLQEGESKLGQKQRLLRADREQQQLRKLSGLWAKGGEGGVRSSPVWMEEDGTTVMEKAAQYDEGLEMDKGEKREEEEEEKRVGATANVSEISKFWQETVDSELGGNLAATDELAAVISGVDIKGKTEYWRQQVLSDESGYDLHRPRRTGNKDQMWGNVVASERGIESHSHRDFSGTADQSEIELLCGAIHERGERYDDGTAAISFADLFKVFPRASVVSTLMRARRHGLLYFEGEIISDEEADDDVIVLQKSIFEIREAFEAMRRARREERRIKSVA